METLSYKTITYCFSVCRDSFFFFYFREGESCTFTVLSVYFKKGYPEKVVLLRITANAIVSGNMGEEEILHLGGCEFFKSI